ncbi:MAG TPA: hypothetical protein VGF94_12325 [Kofleriaceae bacterium]|jgi:hypothetical protein
MKIPAVFALVVASAATVASAQPKPEENNERLSYKDDKPLDRADPAVRDGDWVQVSTPTPARFGTEFVVVGKEQGQFAQLRFDASSGAVIVRRVHIYFDDGEQKVVDVDQVLRKHGRTATIDLGTPKPIDRITVTTEPQTKGSYEIYATADTGRAATVTARR